MIYISAQECSTLFIWQLEVQIYNFKKMGIDVSDYHILFSHPTEKVDLSRLGMSGCKIYYYQDTRTENEKKYIPSIKTHLLKKHWKAFPELQNETIFLCDADVIFTSPLDFGPLLNDNICYLSDTTSYIGSRYIDSKGDNLLERMCEIVGVSSTKVRQLGSNAGGAQYLLKNVKTQVWEEAERTCYPLYKYIVSSAPYYRTNWQKLTGETNANKYVPIQSWCAEMWTTLWCLLKFGYDIKVSKELDFNQAPNPIIEWDKKKIYHNAGGVSTRPDLFSKSRFRRITPKNADFSILSPKYCSINYARLVQEYYKNLA